MHIDPASVALPEHAGLLTRFRVGLRALRHLRRNPDDPVAGPALNSSFDLGIYDQLIEEMKGSEAGRRLLAERPSLQGPDLDLEALDRLPDGSLGRAFVAYFRSNGIQPFRTTFEIRSDRDYIGKRYRETHDLAHVLTGYTTDSLGEMRLQAFVQGNLGIKSAWLILALSVPTIFASGRAPFASLPAFLEELRTARRRGASVGSLLLFPFEDCWALPVEEVRARFFARPGASGLPNAA